MAIVKKSQATITSIIKLAAGVFTVTMETEKIIRYEPGQFLHLSLDYYDPSGQWPESRCFSIQNPFSGNKIVITYSVNGKYTERMSNELKIGSRVWLKFPYGDLFQRGHSTRNCVFIAGGTGITPFLSLFNSKMFESYNNPILYYGIRSVEYLFFNDALELANRINPLLSVEWVDQSLSGVIDIQRVLNITDAGSYFISGPPKMIKYFREELIKNGIQQEKIFTDDWE